MWIVHYPKRKYQFVLKLINFVYSRQYNFLSFFRNWSSTCFRLLLCVCTLWTWVWNPCWRSCTGTSQACRVQGWMQGKLFQKCTHLLYCSVLSLGANVNTRRMSKPDMGSIFHVKNQWNILVFWYYVNYQNYQNLML